MSKKKKKVLKGVDSKGKIRKEFLEEIPPLIMINYISNIMQKYIHTHWGEDKLEAKDLFVITKFFHLSISNLEGFSEDDVRDGMDVMNNMNYEEEFKYGCDLLEVHKTFDEGLGLKDNPFMYKV